MKARLSPSTFDTSGQKINTSSHVVYSSIILVIITLLQVPASCLSDLSSSASTSSIEPSAPTDLKVVAVSSSSAELTWKEATSPISIVAYVISYKISGTPKELQTVSNTTRVILDKLYPLKKYTVTVRAFNTQTSGKSSAPVEFETREDVPSGIPSLDLKPVSPTVLRVSWRKLPLATARGQIIKYEIHYRIHSLLTPHPTFLVQETVPSDAAVDNNSEEYLLENLKSGVKYDVRVVPATSVGFPTDDAILTWSSVEMPTGGSFPINSLHSNNTSDTNSSNPDDPFHHDNINSTHPKDPLNNNQPKHVPENHIKDDREASRDLMIVQNMLLWILASAGSLFILILVVVCVAYRRRYLSLFRIVNFS